MIPAISLDCFLRCVQENAARIHAYKLGRDGSDGTSDCIGLIIGALKLAGFKWPGIHGSNWAARNAMETLEPIENAGELFPGEIVYKAREPGEDKYALPSQYNNSGDLRDYYHVGVVTGVEPLEITHCTSVAGGIKRDNTLGAWRWGGKLKYVDYSEDWEDDEPMDEYWAMVHAESGRTVNMRKDPYRKSTIIARVPIGEKVRVLEECAGDGAWAKVSWSGKTGYMMAEYLVEQDEPEEGNQDEDTVPVPRETLDTWADVLEEMAADIRELIGQG